MPQLYDQIKRSTPPSNLPQKMGFYKPLEFRSSLLRSQPERSADKSLSSQIKHKPARPAAIPRMVDHERVDRLLTQEHGMKIRLGDKTIGELDKQNASVLSKLDLGITSQQESNRVLMKTIRRSIEHATNEQIRALSDAVGVPVTASITDMKEEIATSLNSLFEHGHVPALKRQKKILAVLKEIRDKDESESVALEEFLAEPEEKKDLSIITPGKWQGMDKSERTIVLKAAAARYLMTGKKIKDGTDEANDMDNKWKFITGDNKLIPIKDVKSRMNQGEYILNLRNFTISR